jgi:uracil-DNA glycosylase family 4
VIRPVDVLLEFLEAEQSRGVTHVHLDDGARDGLRGLFNLAKNGGITAPPAPMEQVPPAKITMPEPEAASPVAAAAPSIEGASRVEQLDSLRRQAVNSGAIKALGSLRETMVFASGNPEARLMLVGEAPGYHEEREGIPFGGEAGQKLDGILKAMGLTREEVYISYIVKFRPATPRQTTNNRKPTPEEMAACLPFIRAEIGIVNPACIIALGETAALGLLGLDGAVATVRESWHTFEGTPVRVTYHPSTLLQTNASGTTKRQLWEDMLAVMEKLGLPVSDKQRGFFLPKP